MDLTEFVHKLEQRQFPVTWSGHWIGNRWVPGKRGPMQKAAISPNNGQTLLEVSADKEPLAQAVNTAFEARVSFGSIGLEDRLGLLKRFRDVLVRHQHAAEAILRIEAGKPHWEARDDFDAAIRYMDSIIENGNDAMSSLLAPARLGSKRGEFAMLPIGVTAAYLPFSTPITSFAFYFSATVLAGCPLILNTSTHSMLTGMLLALVAQDADLPAATLNIVFGNFNTFKQLFADNRIAAVLYNGSREHCDTIRLESRGHVGRQVVLQSGGKNAVIVHSSADLTHAVKCIVYGALKSAGQRCSSTSRVFIYRSLLPRFREQLVDAFRNVRIGRTDTNVADGQDGPLMGPLYSAKAVEKYLRYQTMANREAEQTLLWGKAIESDSGGFFVSPSIHHLKRFDNASAYQGNVLFCPDIAIYDYDVLDTAIEQINTTDAAFAVSFIGDPDILASRRQLFLAPNLLVNTPTVEMDATLPLAGRLQSGHHRFHGPGIALYLCYPQVLVQDSAAENLIKSWPWPSF